jgi:hypothetical protein
MTTMRQLAEVATSRGVLVPSAAVLAMGAGFLVGYKYATHILEGKYSEQLQDELDKTKEYYTKLYKQEEFETPEKAIEALIPEKAVEALRTYTGNVPITQPAGERPNEKINYTTQSEVVKEQKNVFTRVLAPLDIEEERKKRTEEAPYIISEEEFGDNEEGHAQSHITFYEGDGVLADTDDSPMIVDEIVGDNNIVKFGQWSNDPRILFVRNHRFGTDYEITLSAGKYAREVAGLE